ncbi:MAG: M48 family metalloprotease, partial [Gammaproteobacteria bacterium]|nr:M48 family metalloprotease [Gammaproteobacteria bacterium]
ARLAGREKMIAALEKLALTQGQSPLPDQIRAFGIAGGIGQGMRKLLMTHPPLTARIRALREAA